MEVGTRVHLKDQPSKKGEIIYMEEGCIYVELDTGVEISYKDCSNLITPEDLQAKKSLKIVGEKVNISEELDKELHKMHDYYQRLRTNGKEVSNWSEVETYHKVNLLAALFDSSREEVVLQINHNIENVLLLVRLFNKVRGIS